MGFPDGSVGKESACNAGATGSIPRWGRSPGGGHGNPPQYSCLKNPMDRGAWRATVQRVAKSRTRLSDEAHNHNPPPELGYWHLQSPVLCSTRETKPGGHACRPPPWPQCESISVTESDSGGKRIEMKREHLDYLMMPRSSQAWSLHPSFPVTWASKFPLFLLGLFDFDLCHLEPNET